jgi:hypothetical protein
MCKITLNKENQNVSCRWAEKEEEEEPVECPNVITFFGSLLTISFLFWFLFPLYMATTIHPFSFFRRLYTFCGVGGGVDWGGADDDKDEVVEVVVDDIIWGLNYG